MTQGAFLATISAATLCLLLLAACSTTEEAPVEAPATPVVDPGPLPPPKEAPRSRLLIQPSGTAASKQPVVPESPLEQQATDELAPQASGSDGPSRPPAPEPPSAAAEANEEAAVPPAPPPKPEQPASLTEEPGTKEPGAQAAEPELSPSAEDQSDAREEPREQAGEAEDSETEPGAEAEDATSSDLSRDEQPIELEELQPDSQQAALPQADPPERLRLEFEAGAVELTEAMQDQLLLVAQQLREHEEERVQLHAYASGYDEDISRARRLSLARALAVRAFLLDQGVRSTRMDVRAVARSEGDAPPDRVDLVPQSQ